MGRVLLAGVSAEHLDQYFRTQKFVALTTQTVTEPKKLRQLIEECRRSGYSAVEDELAYGVVAVAVPVFDQSGARGRRAQQLQPFAPRIESLAWCGSAWRCCARRAAKSPSSSRACRASRSAPRSEQTRRATGACRLTLRVRARSLIAKSFSVFETT